MNRTCMAIVVSAVLLSCAAPGASGAAPEPAFRFAILSDRTGGHTPGVFPSVIDEINLLNPDLVVTMGDHIEGYGEDYDRVEAEWDSVLTMMSVLEAPCRLTPGNHDIWDDRSEAVYRARTGEEPYYSFDYGNTHFVVLDVSRVDYVEDFPEGQMEWLTSDLAANVEAENTFVLMHKPLWIQTLLVGDPDPLHDLFVKYGVDAVFSGHLHHYFAAEFDGIDYTVIGSSGGAIARADVQSVERGEFFQFAWVTVMSSGYELAVVDLGGIYPRGVVTPGDLREVDRIEGELIKVDEVRVYADASPRASVGVTIENASAAPMDDVITWSVPNDWSVEPVEAAVALEPGETKTLAFMMTNSGELYPAPRLSCRYPMSNGRILDVDLPVRIVRVAEGAVASAPPVLDGVPSDECWERCSPVSRLSAAYGEAVEGATEFAFARDEENLYLSAVCYDPQMEELRAGVEERDGPVYAEDCVGYFFQPDPGEMIVYQIYFNPVGTVFDQRISFDENGWYTADRAWDGQYEVATDRTDDRWSIEVRVPLSEIGAPGGLTSLRANFRRKQARTGASADWQIPIDYNPDTFGEITFK